MSRSSRITKIPKANLSAFTSVRLIYMRPLPWWGSPIGTAGLLLCNLVITGTAVHSTWNYWTEPNVVIKLTEATNTSSDAQQAIGQPEVQWDLRPTWQRAGLSFAHIMAGCMFAGALLAKRQLFIRSVHLVTPTTTSTGIAPGSEIRRLIIQSAADSKNTGFEFPAQGAWLEAGQLDTEVVLRSNYGNLNSRFELPLRGASICGKQYPIDDVKNRLAEEWKKLIPTTPAQHKR